MSLKIIREAFEDHNILTEETKQSRTQSPYLWIIDPLDGTINYASGLPLFAVSIGVQYQGNTIAGVINLPALGEVYTAVQGEGAYEGGRRLTVTTSELSEAVVSVILTSHFSEEHSQNTLNVIKALTGSIRGVRIIVCEAFELASIASGRLDGNICIKADAYGAAAGQLLIEEAGGRVTEFSGRTFDKTSQSIVASNGVIHKELTKITSSLDTK